MELIKKKQLKKKRSRRELKALTKAELAFFSKTLKQQFSNKVQILDAYKYRKMTGGSGGLYRVKTLVKFSDKKITKNLKNNLQVIEFKSNPPMTYNPMA